MAKNTEEAQVVVTMNGQAAINEMKKLESQMDQYREAAAKAYVEGDKALGDKLTKKIETLQKEVKVTKKEMKDFGDAMKSLNSKSLSELTSMAKQLESQLKKLGPETAEFAEKSKQLQQVNTRVRSLKDGFRAVTVEVKESTLSLKGLSEGFNRYFGMVTAGIAAITGVSMAFRKTAEEAAKLDDTYSDVMKTTGLMHEEVEALDKQLMELDTRTSREQLLLLARDAGKLGIQGSENILGFVRAADQIQVALGEDLGEGAIRNLGKIADVLGYTKTMGIEQSLLSIGSAVNAVGQASTANEAYLVDFTQRLAGVAAQAGISGANIIGFASGLDQSAMKVEMAATAFQKFLMSLYEDPAKMASYAKMEVEEFTNLLNNDANAAVITILRNLKDQDGFAALVPMFKDMGLDGARAVSVLAAMASNLDAITDAQALANVEFEKANSLSNEFATKNNNMQASLDKARKEFKNASIALGQSLNPILLKSTNATTYLIKALANYGKEIKTVLIVIAALTVALKAKVIWQKVVATWNATLKAGALALSAAQALLTGNIQAATAAWGAMSAVMKTTIFGLIAAAISAVVIALEKLVKKQKESNAIQIQSIDIDKKIAEKENDELNRINRLKEAVHDQSRTYYERNKALEELKDIVPEYHASLTEEGELINDNVDALDKYIKKIHQAAVEAAVADEMADLSKREVTAKLNKMKHQEQMESANSSYSGDAYMGHTVGSSEAAIISEFIAADELIMNQIAEERKELNEKIKMMIESGDLDITGGNSESLGNREEVKKQVDKQIKSMADVRRAIRDQIQEQMDIAEADRDKRDFSVYNKSDSDIKDPKANEEFWNKIYAKRDSIVAALENDSMQKEYDIEMQWAEKLHEQELLTDEEYERRKLQLKLDYASKAAEELSQISEKASSLVNAIRSAETAHAEAEYQAQLTAAGDNAQQREAIETRYEQRKLDIQKKYADADMVINIAKAVAAGALAAVEAFAAAGGNPILGGVFAAIIAATTAAEVATIIAQRNAIKSQTVSMPTSSASAAGDFSTETSGGNIGSRVVTGYARGGYTEDHTTLTTVGERGTEWIAPHWMVKQNPITFANLESYRRAGSHGRSGSVARGFADGGYTPGAEGGENGFSAQLAATLSANTDASNRLASLIEKGLHAYVLLSEIQQTQDRQNRFNDKTSR